MKDLFPSILSSVYAYVMPLYPLVLHLVPLESCLLSIQQHLWASKGRGKETAVPQAAQSAASGVRTRRLLFANSVGFSALMSARFRFCPGKWLCLLTSATEPAMLFLLLLLLEIWLSKLHQGLKTRQSDFNPVEELQFVCLLLCWVGSKCTKMN